MEILSATICINGVTATVSEKTTRSDLVALFGEPHTVGGFSRRKKRGQILKYEETEFHFMGDKDNDTLILVYRDQVVQEDSFTEISIKFHNEY